MIITNTTASTRQKNNFGQIKIKGKGWTSDELHAVTKAYGQIADEAKGKADIDLVREKISGTIYHRTLASKETKSFVGRLKKFLTGETDLNTPPRGLLSRKGIIRQTAQKLFGLDRIRVLSESYSDHELQNSKNLQDWFVKSSKVAINELELVVANSEKTRTKELKAEIKKHEMHWKNGGETSDVSPVYHAMHPKNGDEQPDVKPVYHEMHSKNDSKPSDEKPVHHAMHWGTDGNKE